jgi:hypothetical protein
VLRGLAQHLAELVGLQHPDLAVEVLEEAHVAGLVGDLRAEEDFLVLGRHRPHDRPQLLGHLLLADEEGGEPVHALEPLLLADPLVPVFAVAAEVELLGLPLLPLPEVVELGVAEQLDLRGAVGGLVQRRVRGRLEVGALGPRLGPGCSFDLHAPSLAAAWLPGQFSAERIQRALKKRPYRGFNSADAEFVQGLDAVCLARLEDHDLG